MEERYASEFGDTADHDFVLGWQNASEGGSRWIFNMIDWTTKLFSRAMRVK